MLVPNTHGKSSERPVLLTLLHDLTPLTAVSIEGRDHTYGYLESRNLIKHINMIGSEVTRFDGDVALLHNSSWATRDVQPIDIIKPQLHYGVTLPPDDSLECTMFEMTCDLNLHDTDEKPTRLWAYPVYIRESGVLLGFTHKSLYTNRLLDFCSTLFVIPSCIL